MDKPINQDETTTSFTKKLLHVRLLKSLFIGVVLTLLSLIIIDVNLSTSGGITINDDVNRYFDTCVGEAFISSTPEINVDERGFPLSYVQTSHVPVCEDGVEIKQNSTNSFDLGAFGANILFWTCVIYILLRSYMRKKHVRINRAA